MSEEVVASPLPVAPSRDGGRYTLQSLLGRGGMGEVYLARDERLRRQVAIKRIRPAAENEEHLRARLEQEARVLAQLGHPSIVQVFDIIEDADGAWVVMELVLGRTLAKVLDAGTLDVDTALSYGMAIAAALDTAHQKGIVHRDLKVENVMLSASGEIKILDFGLAKRLLPSESSPALSVEGQVMGTVRTMSPEQARGLPVDERSDLFSLGVLLYEALSGSSPFAGATALDTLVRLSTHRQTSLVELPGLAEVIPPALSELVDELLDKAVERRPVSAAEVRDRLAAIAEARPPVARKTPPRATPARGLRAAMEQQSTVAVTAATVSLKSSRPASRAAADVAAVPGRSSRPELDSPTAVAAEETLPVPKVAGEAPRPLRPRRRYLVLGGLGVAVAVPVVVLLLGGGERPSARSAAAAPTGSAVQLAGGPAAAAPPRDPKAEYERGMALLRNFHRAGAIDEAAGIFQHLLRDNEGSAAAYAGLARVYWLQYKAIDVGRDPKDLQQARAAADRAVALDGFFVDALVSHGLVMLEAGSIEQAEKDLQAALALDGKSADAYDGIARVRVRQQRWAEAEAAYRKALALAPDDRQLHDALGGLLLDQGRYQEASRLFEQSIALAPDSIYGYSNLGVVYLQQGRYAEAAQRFQDALKIRPSSALYTNLGTVLFAQGLYGPAAAALERALSMGAGAHDYMNWANLADAYRQLPDSKDKAREHYDQAIKMIDSELRSSPRDVTLLSRQALFLAKRGDCPRADAGVSSLSDARELSPYAEFRIAVALEICGHRARAIAVLEHALGRGFAAAEIEEDPDLRALRADPAYQRMIQRRAGSEINPGSSPK